MASKNEQIIETALERFKQAQKAESEDRERAVNDVQFANDEQWDTGTLQERRGRPSLTVNKIAGTLKQLRGSQRQARPSIKVRPVDSAADPEVAKILNGLIKNIEYTSNATTAYDLAFDQAIEGGWGYFRIHTDYAHEDTFEQDICIKRVLNPFSVYLDPSFTEADASDANWAFIADVMDKEQFQEEYPNAEFSSWTQSHGEEKSDWWTNEGIRVAEYFDREPVKRTLYQLANGDVMNDQIIKDRGFEVKEFEGRGKFVIAYDEIGPNEEPMPVGYFGVEQEREVKTHRVMWCKMTRSEILEGPQEIAGKYIPIVLVPGEETVINGKRMLKSAHRHAKDAQRVYNWMVSTAVETVSMAPKQPWLVTPEQIEGHEGQWNVAHRRPQPYLLYNPDDRAKGPPSRQQGAVPDAGATQERMQAADDIKSTTGIYDASLGADGGEQSGRQVQARQLEGDISTFVFMDNLSRAIRHAGRIIVDLIPYIYDSERVVRILGPDGTEQFAEINKTVVDMQSGEVQTINDVTQGKYDVVIDVGPSYPTQRAEAAKHMLEFVKAMPQMGPMFMDLIAKNMDWPGSDEIYERLQKMQQGGQQQPSPQEQLELQDKQLEVQKAMADLEGKELQKAKDVQDMAKQSQEMEQSNEDVLKQVSQVAVAEALQRLGITPGNDNNQQQQPRPRQRAAQTRTGGAR